MAQVSLDPLRDPIHDRIGHEAGHLAALRWLGYSADLVQLDLRWADWGRFGHIEFDRAGGDLERESRDRSTIAAIGPLLAGVDLDHPSARSDVACVDVNAEPGWSVEAWRWLTVERARELARTEAFRDIWKRFVLALGDLGERYVELHDDEVDRFLERSVSNAC